MPPAKPHSALMRMVDSDPEDELSDFPASAKPRTAATPVVPAKKPRGRPPKSANKVTKPAQKPTTRTSGRLAAAVAAEIEETPEAQPEESKQPRTRGRRKKTEDVLPDTVEKPKATRGRPRAAKAAAAKPADAEEGEEDTTAHDAEVKQPAPKPRGRPRRKPPSPKTEIPETQLPEAMDIDDDEEHDDEHDDKQDEEHDDLGELPPRLSSESTHAPVRGTVPSSTRNQRVVDMDMEMGEPSLRRRVGELTRKYETLETKYRQLQEVGTKEAERNFDKFKKHADERAQTSNELISNLKVELAAQTSLAKQGPKLEAKIEAHEATITSLQQKITELTTSLSGSKAEIKTLSTKLAASRSAEVAHAKVPGSAMKSKGQGLRNGANADIMHTAQMKEDLYGDLTGLIVTGVKTQDKEDVFDCLQTGRNGTLHFKLSIETDISGDGFEEAQVTYQPQLNPSRDSDLIDMLPDFLVEDISFPRPHSAKFYARVTKALME